MRLKTTGIIYMHRFFQCLILVLFTFISGCNQDQHISLIEDSETTKMTDPFQIEYGKPYPIKPFGKDDFPLPVVVKGFSVPMPASAELPMFFDYQILIVSKTEAIYAIQAKRTYPDLSACLHDKKLAENTLLSKIQNLTVNENNFTSEDLTVEVYCGHTDQSRFVALNFSIFHKATQQTIKIPD